MLTDIDMCDSNMKNHPNFEDLSLDEKRSCFSLISSFLSEYIHDEDFKLWEGEAIFNPSPYTLLKIQPGFDDDVLVNFYIYSGDYIKRAKLISKALTGNKLSGARKKFGIRCIDVSDVRDASRELGLGEVEERAHFSAELSLLG